MTITLLSIGKTKSKHCAQLEQEYGKRISGAFRFERRYVKNEKALQKEIEESAARIVLLDEYGDEYTSIGFANYIKEAQRRGDNLVFVIGDAPGFSDEVRAMAHSSMALSQMTMPHELARVFFTEQLYRAQTIISGHPYHK